MDCNMEEEKEWRYITNMKVCRRNRLWPFLRSGRDARLGVQSRTMQNISQNIRSHDGIWTGDFPKVDHLNTALILNRPCPTQSKSSRFRSFFFLPHFTTCSGLNGHHQRYTVCLRSLLCFPFDVRVLHDSTCFSHVTLRHTFVSNHLLGLYLLNILLSFPLVFICSACTPDN
jgi:hypothetical protein